MSHSLKIKSIEKRNENDIGFKMFLNKENVSSMRGRFFKVENIELQSQYTHITMS